MQTRTAQGAGAGLVAFSELLARLNNPQNNYKIIHVAGTNGKGTVCTLLAHTLTVAGHKTGLFVSPHLVSATERIQINGRNISPKDFKETVQIVLDVQKEPLNLFELLTAVAFVYFARQNVDYVVLETGLGGRKDPTNVCVPVLSIITSVGLDHTQVLGHTLAQIAVEKAGIIKPGVPVICAEMDKGAAAVIEQTALKKDTMLTWIGKGKLFHTDNYDFANGYTVLHTAKQDKWLLHLLGGKQLQNSCLVHTAAQQLGVPEKAIQTAFKTICLPGRFECIKQGDTTFILDGAHNPQAMENLVKFWQKTPYAPQNPTLLCAFMKDKDFIRMLTLLIAHFTRIIVTVPPSIRGAVEADFGELLKAPQVTFEPDCRIALKEAQKASLVLCTGSFYLVGAVRARLLNALPK